MRPTIVITTHQVEEVENLLTDAIFIDKGRIVLDSSLDDIATRFVAVAVAPDKQAAARSLKPFYEHNTLGKSVMYYEGVDRPARQGSGSCTRPASRIYSSPNCPEVRHEHLPVADTSRIVGTPFHLDRAWGYLRTRYRGQPVR